MNMLVARAPTMPRATMSPASVRVALLMLFQAPSSCSESLLIPSMVGRGGRGA